MRLAPTPRPPRLSRSGLILSLYLSLAAAGIAWGALTHRPNVFVIAGARRHILQGLALATGFALLFAFLTRWATHRLSWARTLNREFKNILGAMGGGEIFLLALASSVGEETFFRGAMLRLGPLVSSALFALPHIGPGLKFIPWTISSFLVGLIFWQLFVYSGDLSAPICAHFLINLINLRYITDRQG